MCFGTTYWDRGFGLKIKMYEKHGILALHKYLGVFMAQARAGHDISKPGLTLKQTGPSSSLAKAFQALAHSFSQWG